MRTDAKVYMKPAQAEACAEWLVEVLEEVGEPMKPKEVVALAKEYGFTRATVYRAREKLGEAIEELGSGPRDPRKRWACVGLRPTPGSSALRQNC